MNKQQKLTGIVLSEYPLGENDKRLTILTKERGKIQLISRGCRKAKSHLHAISRAVTYGDFEVSAGRNYNYLTSGECRDSFGQVKNDLDKILYSSYFCEVTEYFTVEDQDQRDILNLLYVTLSAMKKDLLPLTLIRRIFELRILEASGLGIQCCHCVRCGARDHLTSLSLNQGGLLCQSCADQEGHKIQNGRPGKAGNYQEQPDKTDIRTDSGLRPDVIYALRYALSVPLRELYSFRLEGETLDGFERLAGQYFRFQADHYFRSEKMINELQAP